MKKIILSIVSVFLFAGAGALRAENIGVPSECEDVMLQAFYWDSYKTQTSTDSKYGRTKWIDLLTDTAAINSNFDLVWLPPSAYSTGGVGYYHKKLSNQSSTWGQRTNLESFIAALHAGNTKVLADIVINHRGNKSNWCDFEEDDFGSYGRFQLTSAHICYGDECFTTSGSTCYNSTTRGASDTGTNDAGARDLDHTSELVQNWAKAYVQWMRSEMRYDGFRYDMTLGFHGRYLKMYNEAAQPYMSVSELWESISRQKQHLQECDSNTMIFDFQAKYSMKGIVTGSYGKLNMNKTFEGLRKHGLERYSVTFIDNHDTFDRGGAYGDNQFTPTTDLSSATNKNYVLQANAYILMLPGVPCVFWPHWKSYQSEINELIAVRKRAGIHSESAVTDEETSQNMYTATIQGHHGTVILRLGTKRSKEVPEGYELAVEGGDRGEYTVFIAGAPQGMNDVTDEMKSSKFIEDGQLFIRVGEKVYDAQGRLIKK